MVRVRSVWGQGTAARTDIFRRTGRRSWFLPVALASCVLVDCAGDGESPSQIARIRQAQTGEEAAFSDEQVTVLLPLATPVSRAFVAARERLTVFSQAQLGDTGSASVVANLGDQATHLQSEARVHADIYSVADVRLDAKTYVSGLVRTERTIEKQGEGTSDAPQIDGPEEPGTPVPFTSLEFSIRVPNEAGPDVALWAAPTQDPVVTVLPPGHYGHVNVHSRNHVHLSSGRYVFETFNTEPEAQLVLDASSGPIQIIVKENLPSGLGLGSKAPIFTQVGDEAQLLLIFLGTGDVFVQGSWQGTIVARDARILLERPSNPGLSEPASGHQGAFFGRTVEVAAGAHTVSYRPYQGWEALLRCPSWMTVEECDDFLAAPPSHIGDNSPRWPVQARWVDSQGRPIHSFSYAPTGSSTDSAALRSLSRAPQARQSTGGHWSTRSTNPVDRNAPPFMTWTGDSGAAPFEPEGRGRASLSSREPVQLQSLGVPGETPKVKHTLQIRNLEADELGETFVYSVMLRAWGLGNFAYDSIVVPVSARKTIAPGDVVDEEIDLLTHLGIRTQYLAAKADVAVGLHRVLPSGDVEEEPSVLVAVPGFFYNYNEDFSGVYTYSLEAPPPGSALPGLTEVPGLVERYAAGILGGSMFEPDGYVGSATAAEARQAMLEEFSEGDLFRPVFVFGFHLTTHELDANGNVAQPVAPIVPPGSVDFPGTTEPFDSATGPTRLCRRWPVTFVDNGSEYFPEEIATPEWHGLIDFIVASYAIAELYDGAGNPIIGPTRLDADGCLPELDLGAGHYYFRLYSHSIEGTGITLQVLRSEMGSPSAPGRPPPYGPQRALGHTAAIYLRNPGGTISVGTGVSNDVTNVAGVASHALRRQRHDGVDLGLGTTAPNATYKMVTNGGYPVSHYSDYEKSLFINQSTDVWVHDARWKFVIGHELGHLVQDFKGASIPNWDYQFVAGTDTIGCWGANNCLGGPRVNDPQSASGVVGCNCDLIPEIDASHCMQSVEVSEAAQQEGFAHFFAARLWNRTRGDAGFDGSCNFVYYKPVAATTIVDAVTLPPLSVDCSKLYAHRDASCSSVRILDHDDSSLVTGVEVDWLTFFWNITTDPSAPSVVTVDDILSWYAAAISGTTGSSQVTVERLIDRAPSHLQSWLRDRAVEHAVHTP